MSERFALVAACLVATFMLVFGVADAATPAYSLDELKIRTRGYAESVGDHLGDASTSQEPASSVRSTDDRERLATAREFYRRGDPVAASAALEPAISNRRRVNDPAVIDLHLRLLLARGLHAEAAAWLIGQKSADIQTPYTRFNLAVALMQSGQEPEAVTVLYRLGRMRARDAEMRALRDQANLALGWHFLGRDLGGNAKAAFRLIQLHGPQSSAALLGLGWAELAPQGQKQYRDFVGDEASPFDVKDISPGVARTLAERRLLEPELALLVDPVRLPSYPMAQLSVAEKTALGRAVVAWQELQKRDENDPFVWESWIALPYALEKAGVYDQAIEHYRTAIARLESLEATMATDATASGALQQKLLAQIELRILPGSEPALLLPAQAAVGAWAERWIAGREAQVMLNDLFEARQNMAQIEGRVLDLKLAQSESRDSIQLLKEGDRLMQLWSIYTSGREKAFVTGLSAQLESRRQLLRRYRQSAHIALARLLDPELPRPAPVNEVDQPKSLWQRLGVFLTGE